MKTSWNRWSRPLGRSLSLLLLLTLVAGAVTGCSKMKPRTHWWQFWRPKTTAVNPIPPDGVILPPPPGVIDPSQSGAPDELPPPPQVDPMTEPNPLRQAAGMISELQTVFFDYDSSELSPDALAVLDGDAQWIISNPGIEIQIEGHCDERGTVEYNLNLGDQRAKSVKAYLVGKGVEAERLHTISYGEERPMNPGTDEAAWAQNRRVQFLVY